MSKKIILVILFIISCTIIQAQYANWMTGTWKSTGGTTTASGSITNTIQIKDVISESFTGTKTSELGNGAKITIAISGAFRARGLYLQNGEVLQREPASAQWNDCAACAEANKMMIKRDSLILVDSISDCNNSCDGITFYYRLLSEYDDDTQRYLVDRFGRPSDIIGFHPYQQKEEKTVASNDTTNVIKKDVAAGVTLTNAATEAIKQKRQKQVADSLNLVQQKQQQRMKDSMAKVAKLEQVKRKTEDSLLDAQAKKRQQQIADSINLALQKEQQRINDSLDKIARIKQQQIDDSTLLVQQKKREQEIADSLNLVKQKEQQHINDSLNNVAKLEQIRKQTEDSLQQQRTKDSLQNVAAINLQKQRTADSLQDIQAKKRQQEITDSLAAARQQQYNDSLQKAALAKAASPVADSTKIDVNKELTSRSNVLLGSYHITTPDILIELFDNGEIDGDRVSVYHNKEIIVSNQMLNKKAITLNIHADANNREHEFVLVAENLGTIPPNSALMQITAGKQVYKLSVNTDMKTNAKIVFYYDGN